MEITEVFYPKERGQWRNWLKRHHLKKRQIWVRKPHKASGLPVISYDDLVEESLCFGWIDGVVKSFNDESSVQRLTPRRKKGSFLSELNRQRIWKLQKLKLMTPAGIEPIRDQIGSPDDSWEIPDWILQELQASRTAWAKFHAFPVFYQRLKISWIAETKGGRQAPEVARQRLAHLIKKSAEGRRYGTEPLAEIKL
jgi:uncharacterized protein YdeI (YjbR/CyaY-like superfamily)